MRIVAVLVVALVLVAAAAIGYVRTTGLTGQPEPGTFETLIARRVRAFAVPDEIRRLTNPLAATPSSTTAQVRAGLEHYARYCQMCHGADGSGATSAIGRGLFPKPPDMRAAATQQLTDGELFYIIENGVRFTGMPAFGSGRLDDSGATLAWQLVRFLRHLPQLTDDERGEIEGLSPF